MIRRCLGLTLAILVVLSLNIAAQGGRSEVSGVVTDAAGAVLPGVTITATNEGTGLERTTVSGGEGGTSFPRCCRVPTPSRPISPAFRPLGEQEWC